MRMRWMGLLVLAMGSSGCDGAEVLQPRDTRLYDHPLPIEERDGTLSLLHETGERLTVDADLSVTLDLGGSVVRLHEEGAFGAVQATRGTLDHPREGGRSIWASDGSRGFEEWIEVEAGRAVADRSIASWTLDEGVFRPVPGREGVHVILAGRPVAYVTAPAAFTRDGTPVSTRLAVENGSLALYVDARGAPVLVDPRWVATNRLHVVRNAFEGGNTAVAVNGLALIAGSSGDPSGETYDPATLVWSLTGPMIQSRSQHSVTNLADGRVLAVGGGFGSVLSEVFDPLTRTWSAAAAPFEERVGLR